MCPGPLGREPWTHENQLAKERWALVDRRASRGASGGPSRSAFARGGRQPRPLRPAGPQSSTAHRPGAVPRPWEPPFLAIRRPNVRPAPADREAAGGPSRWDRFRAASTSWVNNASTLGPTPLPTPWPTRSRRAFEEVLARQPRRALPPGALARGRHADAEAPASVVNVSSDRPPSTGYPGLGARNSAAKGRAGRPSTRVWAGRARRLRAWPSSASTPATWTPRCTGPPCREDDPPQPWARPDDVARAFVRLAAGRGWGPQRVEGPRPAWRWSDDPGRRNRRQAVPPAAGRPDGPLPPALRASRPRGPARGGPPRPRETARGPICATRPHRPQPLRPSPRPAGPRRPPWSSNSSRTLPAGRPGHARRSGEAGAAPPLRPPRRRVGRPSPSRSAPPATPTVPPHRRARRSASGDTRPPRPGAGGPTSPLLWRVALDPRAATST